jgi:hypothetical protein
VDFASKANSSNVREVNNVFDTCSNLGQLFPCKFENLYNYFPQVQSKIDSFSYYCMELFETSFKICVKNFLS